MPKGQIVQTLFKIIFLVMMLSPSTFAQQFFSNSFINKIKLDQQNLSKIPLGHPLANAFKFFSNQSLINGITGFGNSGSGLSCRAPDDGQLYAVMLRDIYEKQLNDRVAVRNFFKTTEEQLEEALENINRIDPYLKLAVAHTLYILTQNIYLYQNDDAAPMLEMEDIGPIVDRKDNCPEELIARLEIRPRQNSNGPQENVISFTLSTKHYEAFLSDTDRAALWIHEALYFLLRLNDPLKKTTSSKVIREMVGEIFAFHYSRSPLIQVLQPLYQAPIP